MSDKPASVAETLRAARALIEEPAHWCQHGLAEDSAGIWAEPAGETAVKWCAVGALRHIDGPFEKEAADILSNATGNAGPDDHPHCKSCERVQITDFNDQEDRTHSDILALFDKAIAAAESQAS